MGRTPFHRQTARSIVPIITIALLTVGCGQPNPDPSTGPVVPSAASSPATAPSASPVTPAPSAVATIQQPEPPAGLPTAPEGARVDIEMPVFTNPTSITNPLFPISRQASVLMLGRVDDEPFRTEVTLLPFTRIIDWDGVSVETLVSQYAAYLDGRITEIAYDYYAQADDGSVWYFGEDVFDFVDGAIVTTEGTWLAGKDGPAAMIMPARPSVGDVYRPENVPGFVFEEVTVKAVDQRLDGPLGPIPGGLSISELHSDGTTEAKLFAPGYGEFRTGGGGDVEALALAVPTDALDVPVPADLEALSAGALTTFDDAGAGRWTHASTMAAELATAWRRVSGGDVPPAISADLDTGLRRLDAAIKAKRADRARSASIEVARSAFDLQLRHRPTTDVDLARFDLWAAQTLVDASAEDAAGVNASVFALDYIRDRFVHILDAPLATQLNTQLNELQAAVIDDDFETATDAATELRRLLAGTRS